MGLVDSHCHLNDSAFDGEVNSVLNELKINGFSYILIVGWDVESSKKAIEIARMADFAYAAIGVHPENIKGLDLNSSISELRNLSRDEKVVAIGEIGLDYHWENYPEVKALQKVWFERQIDLANELSLPVSIHARDAISDTLSMLREHRVINGGSMHCYSGSPEMLSSFAELGFCFGFDGPVTYKNAKNPVENALVCPLERFLTETDSPYLPPVPYRGKRNSPIYVKEILAQCSEIKGIPFDLLSEIVKRNFERTFPKVLWKK